VWFLYVVFLRSSPDSLLVLLLRLLRDELRLLLRDVVSLDDDRDLVFDFVLTELEFELGEAGGDIELSRRRLGDPNLGRSDALPDDVRFSPGVCVRSKDLKSRSSLEAVT